MHEERASRPSFPVAGDRARLHIEGVRSPILAKVSRRRVDGMTCVQELPFLRLESPVHDDHGRKARIARVSVAVEKNVPKLVIELQYDDDDHDDPSPPGVHARPFGAPASRVPVPRPRRRIDDTIGYDEHLAVATDAPREVVVASAIASTPAAPPVAVLPAGRVGNASDLDREARFRADPIVALREPPISLAEVVTELGVSLRAAFARLERSLERWWRGARPLLAS